jgi:hypothetical protein
MSYIFIIGISFLVILFVLCSIVIFNIALYLKQIIKMLEQFMILCNGWSSDIIDGIHTPNEDKNKTKISYARLEEQLDKLGKLETEKKDF